MGNTPNSRYEVDVVSVALSQGHKHSTLTSHGDSRYACHLPDLNHPSLCRNKAAKSSKTPVHTLAARVQFAKAMLICRELGTPTAIVRNSLRTSIRTRPYSIAGKLCSYAALTGLTVLLVSFTPQMHHNTDTASAATSNSTGGMQRDTTYQTQEGLAPLLGANEGLLRPGAASAVNLPMPSFMRGWLSPSFPRQHGIQTHAWRSTLAWNQLTAPYAAQYQPVKAPSPSTTLWARLAHVTEQNQQLESKLAAATQTARLYEDARLRLAEVESDLARVSEESKLSSAYLVAAVRQLSSASQTLDAPTASHSQSTVPAWRSDVAGAKVLLGLAAAIWVALHHRHKSSLYAEQHALEEAGAEVGACC